MHTLIHLLRQPIPWYIAGPLIGLTVPALLLAGNKMLGISGTLRQLCAIVNPVKISFLDYDWKKQVWNLIFVFGILLGGFIAGFLLQNTKPVQVSARTIQLFHHWNIQPTASLLPKEIFSIHSFLTLKGFIITVLGGFLIGFGTRYAGGCTSGHGIMGLSALQFPSLLSTVSFFTGGIITSWVLLPLLLN